MVADLYFCSSCGGNRAMMREALRPRASRLGGAMGSAHACRQSGPVCVLARDTALAVLLHALCVVPESRLHTVRFRGRLWHVSFDVQLQV